jgi:hypothetical protein
MKVTPTWTKKETTLFKKLDTPRRIQDHLDRLVYDPDPASRSPRFVIRERKAHCFSGALFAACALRFLGHRPLLVDLRAVNDDDHVIAVYKRNDRWGALAKSNFTTLRFREPVYRSVRELAMSYFDLYFNTLGEKTLREYSAPFDLARFDAGDWMRTDGDLEHIGDALDDSRHYPLIDKGMAKRLEMVDKGLLEAGLMGSNAAGLYKPKKKG